MKTILVIVLLTIVYLFGMSKLDNIRQRDLQNLSNSSSVVSSTVSSSSSSKTSSSSSSTVKTLSIKVEGEVVKAGTYSIPYASSMSTLIEKFGGFTDEADKTCYDIDYVILESRTIYFPAKGSDKICINTASIEELEELDGIGATTAQKIIEYREANGKFGLLEDITKVSGISTTKFSNIKDKISLS